MRAQEVISRQIQDRSLEREVLPSSKELPAMVIASDIPLLSWGRLSVVLTPSEWAVMRVLSRDVGMNCSYLKLYAELRGSSCEWMKEQCVISLHSIIKRLRAKLEGKGIPSEDIRRIRGYGFRLGSTPTHPIPGSAQAKGKITLKPMEMYPAISQAFWKDEAIEFTISQFAVVKRLVLHPKMIVPHSSLYALVHDDRTDEIHERSSVSSTLKRIRKKFVRMDKRFDCLVNHYDLGYSWS